VSYKVAGIDVHKKVLTVVVCEVAEPESLPERRRFGTTTSELRSKGPTQISPALQRWE
jgi:hypothetical protein